MLCINSSMISLLVSLLIFVLVAGVIWYCISLIPLPAPFGTIVSLVFMLICVLVLISFLWPLVGGGFNLGYHSLR
jgi:hypothetical protein